MIRIQQVALLVAMIVVFPLTTFALNYMVALVTLAPLVSTTLPPMGQWQTDRDRALNVPEK